MLRMPNWVVVGSYFLHMVATVVWVGGISLMALVVYPAVHRATGGGARGGAIIAEIQRRFSPLAMLSLAALVVTGLTQMSVNPNYHGLFSIQNTWAVAILLKHVAFIAMSALGAYSVWGIGPALARLALLEAKGGASETVEALRRREESLNRLNAICALVVLFFTAVARSV